MEKVSLKTPIGGLILSHPVAAAVLLERGFHCIGCQLAAYETIEEGAAAHGMDGVQTDALVEEINGAIEKEANALKKAAMGPKPEKAQKKSKTG
jgi:hybrid cluster-associated redox disulfide protein